MAFGKKNENEFFGKEITDAIKSACEKYNVGQEKLDIEIISTGSAGIIFGLGKKKAHIRAVLKEKSNPEIVENKVTKDKVVKKSVSPSKHNEEFTDRSAIVTSVSPENIVLVEKETLKILELMQFPAKVSSTTEGGTINCVINTDHDDELTAQDGKILDSLQYIVRKIVVKKIEERVRINLDVNDFRNRRLEMLKVKAVELATQVKEDGKTQVITSLNPSERRVIHIILQEDKEIRSRSVGDGLFKKILIYKPGKGNRGGRKRYNGNNNRNRTSNNRPPKRDKEE
ncbi:MAG: Jag N-terminal domain-containing protein [Desulfotalea sp.]